LTSIQYDVKLSGMTKKAWMFSGQGTQEVGMGRELLEAFKEVENVARKAEEVTNRPIRDIMLRGPKDILDRTSNTQIAVTVISLGLLAV
jgi:[acyl-carrier-protein] S-malonyltransferase